MRLVYLLLLMMFAFNVSAQDVTDSKSLDATEIPGFKLYPNPAFDDVVYITTTQNALKEVTIYDIFGKVVLQSRISDAALDISHLDPGVYVLLVVEEKKRITRKLVVK